MEQYCNLQECIGKNTRQALLSMSSSGYNFDAYVEQLNHEKMHIPPVYFRSNQKLHKLMDVSIITHAINKHNLHLLIEGTISQSHLLAQEAIRQWLKLRKRHDLPVINIQDFSNYHGDHCFILYVYHNPVDLSIELCRDKPC